MRKKSKKGHTTAFTGNTDVSMYASPAYGTHQVFTEPELDYLYDRADESHLVKRITSHYASTMYNDDEADVDGYLRMNPSFEFNQQTVTESSIADTGSTFRVSKLTDEQAVSCKINEYLLHA